MTVTYDFLLFVASISESTADTFRNDNFAEEVDNILKVRIVSGPAEFEMTDVSLRIELTTLSGTELNPFTIQTQVCHFKEFHFFVRIP